MARKTTPENTSNPSPPRKVGKRHARKVEQRHATTNTDSAEDQEDTDASDGVDSVAYTLKNTPTEEEAKEAAAAAALAALPPLLRGSKVSADGKMIYRSMYIDADVFCKLFREARSRGDMMEDAAEWSDVAREILRAGTASMPGIPGYYGEKK